MANTHSLLSVKLPDTFATIDLTKGIEIVTSRPTIYAFKSIDF